MYSQPHTNQLRAKKMNYSDDRFSVDDILEEVTQHHPHDDTSKADADLLIDEILKRTNKTVLLCP